MEGKGNRQNKHISLTARGVNVCVRSMVVSANPAAPAATVMAATKNLRRLSWARVCAGKEADR